MKSVPADLPTVNDGIKDWLNTVSVLRTFYNISQTSTNNSKNAQAVYAYLSSAKSFSSSDLTQFQSTFGLPSTPINGSSSNEALCLQNNGKTCGEGNLDTQYITAIASNTMTYFINDNLGNFATWMASLTALPVLPLVASISYGAPEPLQALADLLAFDVEAIKLSVMGVTIVAASGDDGANGPSAVGDPTNCGYAPNFPASSQYVLAVGATSGPGTIIFYHLKRITSLLVIIF